MAKPGVSRDLQQLFVFRFLCPFGSFVSHAPFTTIGFKGKGLGIRFILRDRRRLGNYRKIRRAVNGRVFDHIDGVTNIATNYFDWGLLGLFLRSVASGGGCSSWYLAGRDIFGGPRGVGGRGAAGLGMVGVTAPLMGTLILVYEYLHLWHDRRSLVAGTLPYEGP